MSSQTKVREFLSSFSSGIFIPAVLFLVVLTGVSPGKTICVNSVAAGANDGTSWVDAYIYLQDALSEADAGDDIWVAAGTYKPDQGVGITFGDRTASFEMINGVGIYGGFPNTGNPVWDQRDPTAYETVLSGDLGITDNPSDNSHRVVYSDSVNSSTKIDGFTITAGNANAEPIYSGGGMLNWHSSLSVTNCKFINNSSYRGGGGMHNYRGNPTVAGCAFIGNDADTFGLSDHIDPFGGGGMCNINSSSVVINCTFDDNVAGYCGGGMLNKGGSPAVINCWFANNIASDFTGGYGGGICNHDTTVILINCTIVGNVSGNASGIYNLGTPIVVKNSILWGNTVFDQPHQVYGVIWFIHSNVQGGSGESGFGVGCIDEEPLFLGDTLRLSPDSPCIDAGYNTAVPPYVTTDITGNPRIFGGVVDMGAYEYAGAVNAIFTASPNPVAVGESVAFDASASFCGELAHSIVSYEWDFDYDGVSFDVEGVGVSTTHAYGLLGLYDVALRVTDDSMPVNADMAIVKVDVSANSHIPSADAGGPYTVNLGQPLLLDASASTPGGDDADHGDFVAMYEWDIDHDGEFDDHATEAAVSTIPWNTLAAISKPLGDLTIGLRVTDNTSLTDTAYTTLAVTTLPLSHNPLLWNSLTIDSDGDVGQYSSLAIDSSGDPRICYFDATNGDLKYASWNGRIWNTETVDSGGYVGNHTSLALDSSGYPRISYLGDTDSDLKYASWNGKSWDIEIVDSDGEVGFYTSLALDSSGRPRISYLDDTNSSLKYAAWNGSRWDIETVDTGRVGNPSSLALDSQGNPKISYRDWMNGDLKYASWNGDSWDIEIVDSSGNVGLPSSLVLDSNGNPRISYGDYYPNYDLKYASWNGSSWDIEIVDSVGYIGRFSSLALDSAGNPKISYCDEVSGDLRYASWNGATWDIQIIEIGRAKSHTSIAIDGFDRPRISYFDGTSKDLKLAVTCDSITEGDLNSDCRVDLLDFAKLAGKWLDCTVPFEPECGFISPPVSHWTFDDGTFMDSKGESHGTAVGNATIVNDSERGKVLLLDGTGDYLNIPSTAGSVTEFTIAMWTYANADVSGVEFAGGLNTAAWVPHGVHFKLHYGRVNLGIEGAGPDAIGSKIVPVGEWVHIAATLAKDGRYAVYYNGLKDASASAGGSVTAQLNEAYIGSYYDTRCLDGLIDDVRIYDYALSETEIMELAGR